MKNRFYYSEKQANCLGYDIANEVFNGTKWVRYSEMITDEFPDHFPKWPDAVLVYATNSNDLKIKINPNHDI